MESSSFIKNQAEAFMSYLSKDASNLFEFWAQSKDFTDSDKSAVYREYLRIRDRDSLRLVPRLLSERLLFTEQAARYINMHKNMLIKFEKRGWVRPFYFPDCRSKRYDLFDLDEMIEQVKTGVIRE